MAKIEAIIDNVTQSGELTKDEVLDLANANTPAGVIPSANVIRDANGKVVRVEVNLPSTIAANDLETARAAINGNNGVASAGASPTSLTGGTYGFEDVADGVAPSAVDGNTLVPLSGLTFCSDTQASAGSISCALHEWDKNGAFTYIGGSVAKYYITHALQGPGVGSMGRLRLEAPPSLKYDALSVACKFRYDLRSKGSDAAAELSGLEDVKTFSENHSPSYLLLNNGKAKLLIRFGDVDRSPATAKHTVAGDEQTFTAFEAYLVSNAIQDKWIEYSASYDAATGTASATLTWGSGPSNTETVTHTGLSGLDILSRFAGEFSSNSESEWGYVEEPEGYSAELLALGARVESGGVWDYVWLDCFIDELQIDIDHEIGV